MRKCAFRSGTVLINAMKGQVATDEESVQEQKPVDKNGLNVSTSDKISAREARGRYLDLLVPDCPSTSDKKVDGT